SYPPSRDRMEVTPGRRSEPSQYEWSESLKTRSPIGLALARDPVEHRVHVALLDGFDGLSLELSQQVGFRLAGGGEAGLHHLHLPLGRIAARGLTLTTSGLGLVAVVRPRGRRAALLAVAVLLG